MNDLDLPWRLAETAESLDMGLCSVWSNSGKMVGTWIHRPAAIRILAAVNATRGVSLDLLQSDTFRDALESAGVLAEQ